jgi:hypothetical protein
LITGYTKKSPTPTLPEGEGGRNEKKQNMEYKLKYGAPNKAPSPLERAGGEAAIC